MIQQGFNSEDEIDEEDDCKVGADVFGNAVIWGTDWTTETIASQLRKGNIELSPRFQRREAWTDKEKSCLIESLALGVPVPPIILAEKKDKKNSFLVIDGKQRLISIRRFFCEESEESEELHRLKLSGLEVLSVLNGKTYDEIKTINREYIDDIENQTIRTIVIKNWSNEAFLYNVFLRLNTGGKKLSPQELRQALRPGPFLDYLDEATADSNQIKKMLNNKQPDSRMRDVELALRYYGFKYCLDEYNGNLKAFLDLTCDKLNRKWSIFEDEFKKDFSELENAIDFSYEIMESDSPFSRFTGDKSNNVFNRSVFELFTFYFNDNKIREMVRLGKEQFVMLFRELNNDSMFIDAVSNTVKDRNKLCTRFNMFSELLLRIKKGTKEDVDIKKLYISGSGIGFEIVED